MSKGDSHLFTNREKVFSTKETIINKISYNTAGSTDVGKVTKIVKNNDHSTPIKGTPYSVNQKHDERGNLISERYYDINGNAYLDIDYSNHGNSKLHPIVPHQHRITITDDKIVREKGEKIQK